jgi:AcrR family transcriptional regulator
MEEKGIQGLTLRAAAREAGASHAAPKNHFGDLTGLLSELAAHGYERFCAVMVGDVPRNRHADATHLLRRSCGSAGIERLR